MARFDEQNVVVTGAASGIGAAVAERFAAEGASGVIIDRSVDVEEIAVTLTEREKGTFHSLVLDLTDAEWERYVHMRVRHELSSVDVLVNCAGITDRDTFEQLTVPAWQQLFDVNVAAVFRMSRALAPLFNPGGSIVNIGSVAALTSRSPGRGIGYATSKAAVHHLTRHLAVALAGSVRVNAVAPGPIRTELTRALWETEDGKAYLLRGVLTGELGDPGDAAAAILFLASAEAKNITGTVLSTDGGASIGGYWPGLPIPPTE